MEQAPKIENKEKKKISKIHFLIHPGYMVDSPHTLAKGESERERYKELLRAYVDKARTIGHDELMFIFAFPNKRELKSDAKQKKVYLEAITEIKNILGERAIVLADNMNIVRERSFLRPSVDFTDLSLEKMRRIAGARGYYFDRDAESEAYGELMEFCVAAGATNLNEAAGLKKKTVIKLGLTDVRLDNAEISTRKKSDIIMDYGEHLKIQE